jgi:hypothetical protein
VQQPRWFGYIRGRWRNYINVLLRGIFSSAFIPKEFSRHEYIIGGGWDLLSLRGRMRTGFFVMYQFQHRKKIRHNTRQKRMLRQDAKIMLSSQPSMVQKNRKKKHVATAFLFTSLGWQTNAKNQIDDESKAQTDHTICCLEERNKRQKK